MIVLGQKMSFPLYLRSAMSRFPLQNEHVNSGKFKQNFFACTD